MILLNIIYTLGFSMICKLTIDKLYYLFSYYGLFENSKRYEILDTSAKSKIWTNISIFLISGIISIVNLIISIIKIF